MGLDGIRALAAGLVLCYHLIPSWRGAGFVGVDMFFVLSGFLITSLLLRELALRKSIRIGNFWVRRIRRLVPAVVFATVGTVALARLVGGDALVQLPWQVAGSLTSTYNWLQIWNAAPYFGQRSPLLLTNVWSLSLEMQFYVVWPVLLVLIVLFIPSRFAPWAALGMAGLSAGWNWYLVHVADDVTRAYVGTDAHAFGLMIGAAIAFWVPGVMVEMPRMLPETTRKALGVLTWVGLAGALGIGVFVYNGPWMYPWGMLAASALTGLTIRGLLPDALSAPSLILAKVLSSRPMVWFGERSYSVYLWHWPLWVLAFFTFRRASLAVSFLVLVVSLVMAEISYRYVETPIRIHGLKKWFANMGRLPVNVRRVLMGGAVVTLFLFFLALFTSPAQSSTERLFDNAAQVKEAEDIEVPPAHIDFPGVWNPAALKDFVSGGAEETLEEEAPEELPVAEAPAPVPVTGEQVTVIGDSVTLVSEAQLYERLPGVFIDSEVSRPMLNLPSVVDSVRAQGMLREYVVVSLAVNGFVREQEIEAMFASIGPDHKIVLVTGYGPENEYWIFDANAKIYEVGERYPDQIRIADWAPIGASNHDLLAGDLTHPGPAASGMYADEIVRALNSFN